MLSIFICEDNAIQRVNMEKIANKQINFRELDMNLSLSTDNPHVLLNYLKAHRPTAGLYLLDVDLQSDINGIELAAKIKELDISATIVFITTHSEMVYDTFKFKVEAMDYIIKDDSLETIEQKVIECMHSAYDRLLRGKHTARKYFAVKVGSQHLHIPYDDIMYFESSVERRNKLILHRISSMLEFRGTIGVASDLESPFCKCHQSFVVNINFVKQIDTARREIELTDGTIIPVAKRKLTEVLKHIK